MSSESLQPGRSVLLRVISASTTRRDPEQVRETVLSRLRSVYVRQHSRQTDTRDIVLVTEHRNLSSAFAHER